MKKCFLTGVLVWLSFFLISPIHAATCDLTGTWNYTLSDCWAYGGINCNPGPEASGTCIISQAGDDFAFAFTSGAVCDPPESCTFSGTAIDNVYTCATTDIVDDENGSVTSTIVFTAASATSADGTGTSRYTHPSGLWECNWGNTISLTKASDYVPVITCTLTVDQTGDGSVTLDPAGGVYDFGTIVTLTPDPDAGWAFDSWSGDAQGSQNPYDIVMDEDKTVTAIFTRTGGTSSGALHLLLDD
ncbi:hypothetical protein DSCA_52960 [Desulfosarcina alkanivorans]|jgi:hypothetical protein|uniref:Bacterial repeat domain-containing protein n=1 Tax=Desulfosarcina alkanivorans TaxID=571177 RepID=A0A5K7YQ34_9BACT|nr:hypothetical protein [Desulfosarcina alkanivorans]BBO71366.1 hypothetical protein DSCA_52960 [Desulfosarcina alkanivorans]